ncbi:MAG: AI-2E family transporter [Gammaproteobacteria bacterium]|nr:AI-2E family transporter [Gammaproteobacteria bacterium]MDH3537001.1 AI-2E family transporter [Gammaproteobacteria bacterium]
MFEILLQWYNRHFTDPQTVIFAFILVVGALLIFVLNTTLMPILIAIIIAYLAEGLVALLHKISLGRTVAASIVTMLMIATIILVFFVLLPLLSKQISELFREMPNMLAQGQRLLLQLPEQYPDYVSASQIEEILTLARTELTAFGQRVVSLSLASVVGIITFLVYMILLPLMVFFFLKDKDIILTWLADFLPEERRLLRAVWAELDIKIASYVRGKVIEVLIIWAASYVAFAVMGLNYAVLLSLAVGLSVIIPYVGATVVTIPVALIAFFQWGFTSEFGWLMAIYGFIQFLDGNLLVPLLFSEVVNLHPVAIIVAVVFFGSLWGVWGVFFAIPLATLIQAILKAWPTEEMIAE